jgi:hypothetical protein
MSPVARDRYRYLNLQKHIFRRRRAKLSVHCTLPVPRYLIFFRMDDFGRYINELTF